MTKLQEHLLRNTEVTVMGHTLTVAACDTHTRSVAAGRAQAQDNVMGQCQHWGFTGQ